MPRRAVLAPLLALLLGGCAITQSTEKIVLDYNRDFAKARNEVLLLNVLRAAAREPLQFSTMGTVQGSVGNGGQLTLPFTNLLAGGKDVISPSLLITDSVNPSVSIVPLTHKEFASGLLAPIKPDTLQLFMHNGWDAHFLLPLVVGGVICRASGSETLYLNSGEYLVEVGGKWQEKALHGAFRDFFYASAGRLAISTRPSLPKDERNLILADKDALAALKDGIGTKYALGDVQDGGAGQKKVTIKPAAETAIKGLAFGEFCPRAAQIDEQLKLVGRPPAGLPLSDEQASSAVGRLDAMETSTGKPEGRITLRSVGSIIHFLGESHRMRYRRGVVEPYGLTYRNAEGDPKILFRIQWGLGGGAHAVDTRFQESHFYIPSLNLREGDDQDRTLKTLSFLDQMLALQTSESAIRGAQAVIAIPQ